MSGFRVVFVVTISSVFCHIKHLIDFTPSVTIEAMVRTLVAPVQFTQKSAAALCVFNDLFL